MLRFTRQTTALYNPKFSSGAQESDAVSVRQVERHVRDVESHSQFYIPARKYCLRNMKLAETLQEQLQKREWSLTELSKKTGIPKTTLHGWATGRGPLDLKQLKKVSEALEISFHQLIFGEPDPYGEGTTMLEEIFHGDVRVTVHRLMQDGLRTRHQARQLKGRGM